jgi:hypothetical protein
MTVFVVSARRRTSAGAAAVGRPVQPVTSVKSA